MERDDRGQYYVRVGNLRITYIQANKRLADLNWSDSDVIRVQSYKNSTDNSLHAGAEFPVRSSDSLVELIEAMCKVYSVGSKSGV